MSIPNNYPVGCSDEQIYETIKTYQESIKSNHSVTVIVQRAAAIIQIGEAELATRLSRKHGEITQELKGAVNDLRKDIGSYNEAATNESKRMRYLTIALGVVTLLQLFIAYKQMKLSEVQGISERIAQARSVQAAMELCNQDKTLKYSGLFFIETGKSASCEEVLRIYGGSNSIWTRIENIFK